MGAITIKQFGGIIPRTSRRLIPEQAAQIMAYVQQVYAESWAAKDDVRIDYYKCPVPLTQADLEYELDTSEDVYGFADYCLFALRRLMPWRKTWPSYKGAICSEKVEQILVKLGWQSPFVATPSPADFERVLEVV